MSVPGEPDERRRLIGDVTRPAPRRLDASMDMLNQIMRQPMDPDYAVAAARGVRPARLRWDLALVAVVVGAMFSMAALQTTRSAPALETERSGLITRIQQAETEQDALRARVTTLSADIDTLRTAALSDDSAASAMETQIATLDPIVGNVAVTGPGLLLVVDDAPSDGSDTRDRVLDLDLQVLANGLWQAGAEAIAVNGHRVSTLTAIRGAGDAITVDYRSLTRPYRIEAIGDPRTLPARWVESAGGAWWNELAQNRRMRYEVSSVKAMTLDADPGMELRYAKKAGS
jgi:uncharacterized protein YlxW (UPF0749 family)